MRGEARREKKHRAQPATAYLDKTQVEDSTTKSQVQVSAETDTDQSYSFLHRTCIQHYHLLHAIIHIEPQNQSAHYFIPFAHLSLIYLCFRTHHSSTASSLSTIQRLPSTACLLIDRADHMAPPACLHPHQDIDNHSLA